MLYRPFSHYEKLTLFYCVLEEIIKKLHGLSPRANYIDRATATCRRSDCQLFEARGDPYGRILGFLDRSRYFSIK
jgi:hypothetical protein